MAIESIKAWQWAVVGLAAGLAVAAVRVRTGASAPLDDRPGAHPQEFMEALSLQTPDGQPMLRDLTIYPPLEGKMFVTGEIVLDSGPGGAASPGPRRFQLNTPVPFKVPLTEAPSPDYTVRDYLAQNHPGLQYRYAWWASDNAQYALWGGGGVVVIGLAWPLVLRLLTGAGFGRQRDEEPEYDLERFSREEPAAGSKAPAGELDPAEAAQLEAAARALEEAVASDTSTATTAAAPVAQPAKPAVTLSNAPLEMVPAPAESDEPKDYKGEFYPVARTTPKHDE